MIAAGAGNVIAAGAGNVIAAGAGNVIAAGAGNVIAAGAGNVVTNNGAARAARHPKAKSVLLLSGGHTFDQAGTAKVKLTFTKQGRKIVSHYKALALRARRAHRRVPKAYISITLVFAGRNGNGPGKPPAVYVTKTVRLMP